MGVRVEPLCDEGNAVAGAFSVGDGGKIARAVYGGVDLIEVVPRGDRRVGRVREQVATTFAAQTLGVQLVVGGLVALGGDEARAFGERPDWRMRLAWWSRGEHRWTRDEALPPGNWRLVRGGPADRRICVYDVSAGQGVRAFGLDGGEAWAVALPSLSRLGRSARGTLVGLVAGERDLIELDEESGAIVRRLAMPSGATWSAAIPLDENELLLGGSRAGAWTIARFTPSSGALETLCELRWDAVASAELLARCEEDRDHCGFDLGDVANLALLDGERALVALGGDGEQLGACQSACAVAIVSLAGGLSSIALVDENDGSCGLARHGADAWLLDCGSRLRLITPDGISV